MKTVVYKGSNKEVELLKTGKRFKRGEPVDVTDVEYKAVINRKDFKGYQPKKKDENKDSQKDS